jgi:hypothetical protein
MLPLDTLDWAGLHARPLRSMRHVCVHQRHQVCTCVLVGACKVCVLICVCSDAHQVLHRKLWYQVKMAVRPGLHGVCVYVCVCVVEVFWFKGATYGLCSHCSSGYKLCKVMSSSGYTLLFRL